MEKYFCDCLNITISVKENEIREMEGKELFQLEDYHENLDPFFDGKLLDVRLGVSGIEMAQDFLCKERCFGDWLVINCLNCGLDTHAIHAVKGADRVLLQSELVHGNHLLKNIQTSDSYSKVFKIKVLPTSERHTNPACSIRQKNIFEATNKINSEIKKLIKIEEDAMNERIRIFTEKQQQQLLEFKRTANRDKENMLKTIHQYEDSDSHDSLFDSISESYFRNPFSEARDQSTDLPQIKAPGRPIQHKNFNPLDLSSNSMAQSLPTTGVLSPSKIKQTTRSNRKQKSSTQSPVRQRSCSDDTLFDLEGFHNNKNCEPFYESDDDSSGGGTSLESSGGFGIPTSRGLHSGDRVYATSVPIGIPLFNNTKNSYELESDDDEEESVMSPHEIADSIKALARSMQDSTGMFGELPRPRLNNTPYSYR